MDDAGAPCAHLDADPDRPVAQRALVAPVDIGIPVAEQQQHGGCFQHSDDAPALARKRLGHQGQNRKYAAYTAHKEHDIELVGFQKIQMWSLPLQRLSQA